MKSKITNHATIIIGLLLLAVSLYLIKTSNDPQGIMRTLPYVCIGIGCGLFGHGMGNVISERAINSYPELKRQLDSFKVLPQYQEISTEVNSYTNQIHELTNELITQERLINRYEASIETEEIDLSNY